MRTTTLEVSRFLAVLEEEDVFARFVHLAGVCGWSTVDTTTLELTRMDSLDESDVAAARRFGGAIKRVLWATCDGDRVEAFAGPALVPIASPLTRLDRERDPVQFSGRYRSAAAPSVTAPIARSVIAPATEWFLRARFPGVTPHVDAASVLFAQLGLHTISAIADAQMHWRRVAAAPRADVDRAVTELRVRHRIAVTAIRAL
jgi:hypothetical protein